MSTTLDQIGMALGTLRSNGLRAWLTVAIIAIGIMALVGMLTAVDGMKTALYSNFSSVGANTFTVSSQDPMAAMGMGGGSNMGSSANRSRNRRRRKRPSGIMPISLSQAQAFTKRFADRATVSLSFVPSGDGIVKYEKIETSPKITITGANAGYLTTAGLEIEEGRNFTPEEADAGRPYVLLGSTLKQDLFGKNSALGKTIRVNNLPFKVLGVLKSKGSSFGASPDAGLTIPLVSAVNSFTSYTPTYEISVQVDQIAQLETTIEEAKGQMRSVRRLRREEEDDFFITKSDSLTGVLSKNVSTLTMGALLIGIITLMGAAIGLTNIMLVSVTERTKEIGTRKALGASFQTIRNQFLYEALAICQVGGLIGIAAGIGLGNLVSLAFKAGFVVPWPWVGFALFLCFLTGIIAGLYPAVKAARLDPIEALRHE